MAKMKKYPKTPKKTASKDSWEKYLEKCKEVDKANSTMEKDKKDKLSIQKKVVDLKKKKK